MTKNNERFNMRCWYMGLDAIGFLAGRLRHAH